MGWLSPGMQLYLLAVTALLGLVFGSFCNAWAWRLAHGESIIHGRSHCAFCGHALAARDLIPVLSYVRLRGRCRYCGARISPRYTAAELILCAFFVSVVLSYPTLVGQVPPDAYALLTLARWLVLGSLLLVAALVDFDTRQIPDRLLVFMAVLFLFVGLVYGWSGYKDGLIGACAVGVPLLLFVLLADRIMGCETMGGADIKLFFVLGLHFGAARTLLILILSSLIGILGAVLAHRGRREPFPFGPAIAIAAWIVLLFGAQFLAWYWELFL